MTKVSFPWGGIKVRCSQLQQRILLCVALSLSFAFPSYSQIPRGQLSKAAAPTSPPPAQTAPAAVPEDPLRRTTPRGTVLGFLAAANDHKYDLAAQYLDTDAHGKDAAVLAEQLFFVLDRKLPAKLNRVSNDPLGSLSDPADPTRELIGSVVTEHGSLDINLQRTKLPNGEQIWIFSRDTLAGIPVIYHEINAAKTMEDFVPDFLLTKAFGASLFGWLYFLVLLPLLYVVLSLLNRLLSPALWYALRRWADRPEIRKLNILPHPVRVVILAVALFSSLHQMSLSLIARQVGKTVGVLLLLLAFVWAVFLLSARLELYLKRRMESQGRLGSTAVLRPTRRMIDGLAILVGFMVLLQQLGINPSTTLAGLGVGGIAIALAAQKTLENIIGGASLIMDDAVRVGDFFKMGDVTGTIEVIGLRSTRVRTLDRTLVTIPNGQMATMTLENFSARDRFWLRQLIGVQHQTTPSALNSLLAEVRELLQQHPSVIPATTRVRFLRFAESSLELEVVAYISAQMSDQFLEIQEDILLRIREVIGRAGVEFAYPARALYLRNNMELNGAPLEPISDDAIGGKETVHEIQAH